MTGGFCPPTPLNIRVNALPPAPNSITGPTVLCFGSPTLYTVTAPLPGTIFSWYAQAGTVSPASNSASTYASFTGGPSATIGVFRITTDEAHCYSDSLELIVNEPVVVGTINGLDTVCPSTSYSYSHTYNDGELYTWDLDVPNSSYGSVGGSGTGQTVSVMYNGITGVTATLHVRIMKCGNPYDFYKNVYIKPVPTPTITITNPSPLCRDELFTASVNVSGSSYTWDWDDGTLNGSTNPANHAYTALSTTSLNYNITVVVTNAGGCLGYTATATTPVTVYRAPVANITPPGPFQVCSGTPNQLLTATLQNGYEPTTSFNWWNVGGTTALASCTTATPPPPCSTYTVNTLGAYFVVATGQNGCSDTSNIVVFDSTGCNPAPCTLSPNPTVSVTGTEQCGQVNLTGSYSGPPPTAIGWNWYGPGNATAVSTTNTTYSAFIPAAGIYPFTYAVTFNDGTNTCTRTATKNVLVRLVPDMGYTVSCDPGGQGYTVTLHDHSNYFPGYAPVGYTFWINNVPHTTTTSSYTTTLPFGQAFGFKTVVHFPQVPPSTFTDSCESFDSLYTPAAPFASFTADSIVTCVKEQAVQFTNLSTGGAPLTYAWDLNGIPNNATNPFAVFQQAVPQPITLTVTDLYGCVDDTVVTVTVLPDDLDGGITANPNPICSGNPITLSYVLNGGNFPTSYYWYEDDNFLYGPTTSSSTNVFAPGSYWLIGKNAIGCRIETPKVVVDVNQPPAAVINGDSTACLDQEYTLYGYAGNDPGISYTWTKVGTGVVGTGDS
ncbi:MAG TPA: PKD domain-containing protein, partial [Fibrella sp.]